MKVPALRGVIERRILVNYRVEPAALAGVLPDPFQPKRVDGWGIGGICLIRLGKVRPAWLPCEAGIGSENAAHRIAVEWTGADGERREGVYVPRRDTSSFLNVFAGGGLFPGEQHHARFEVEESEDRYSVRLASSDGETHLRVVGRRAPGGRDAALPAGSVFPSLAASSAFFEAGSLGYSATSRPGRFDGMELCCDTWHVEALEVEEVASSFFDDPLRFPPGTATFDHALLMRDIHHEWHGREELCGCEAAVA